MQLFRISLNEWYIKSYRTHKLCSSLKETIEYLIKENVELSEIKDCFVTMLNSGDNHAEFGIRDRFIYSAQR